MKARNRRRSNPYSRASRLEPWIQALPISQETWRLVTETQPNLENLLWNAYQREHFQELQPLQHSVKRLHLYVYQPNIATSVRHVMKWCLATQDTLEDVSLLLDSLRLKDVETELRELNIDPLTGDVPDTVDFQLPRKIRKLQIKGFRDLELLVFKNFIRFVNVESLESLDIEFNRFTREFDPQERVALNALKACSNLKDLRVSDIRNVELLAELKPLRSLMVITDTHRPREDAVDPTFLRAHMHTLEFLLLQLQFGANKFKVEEVNSKLELWKWPHLRWLCLPVKSPAPYEFEYNEANKDANPWFAETKKKVPASESLLHI